MDPVLDFHSNFEGHVLHNMHLLPLQDTWEILGKKYYELSIYIIIYRPYLYTLKYNLWLSRKQYIILIPTTITIPFYPSSWCIQAICT